MNTVEKINQNLSAMTKTERDVASFFFGHLNDFAFLSLQRLSGNIGTSTTSVIRFCRRLGFAGFKEFQYALREDMKYQPGLPDKLHRTIDAAEGEEKSREAAGIPGNELLSRTLHQDITCLEQTFRCLPRKRLDRAVELLSGAQRVFSFGMKESFALAHYSYTRFLSVRENCFLLNAGYNGEVESILALNPGDVCMVFLFHRYTKQVLELLPLIRAQGAYLILVTSEPFGAVEEYASLLLPCHVDANGIKNTAVPVICLTDYLCNAMACGGGKKALQYMQRCEDLYKSSSFVEQ